jgi:hypothetical protein
MGQGGLCFQGCHYQNRANTPTSLLSLPLITRGIAFRENRRKLKEKKENPVFDSPGLLRNKGYPLYKRTELGWIESRIFQSAFAPIDKTSRRILFDDQG